MERQVIKMLNVLKSDLYKMKKIRSIWILNAISVCWSFISIFSISVFTDNFDFFEIMSSVHILMPIFVGIFMCMYTNLDYKSGYIKNVAGIVPNKAYMIISKLIITILFTLICFVTNIAADLIFMLIFGNPEFSTESMNLFDMFTHLGTQILLNTALGMISVMFITVTRSVAFSYTFIVLISTSFLNTVLRGIWMILQEKEIVPESFDIEDCLITSYIGVFNSNYNNIDGLIVAIVYLSITTAVSIIAIRKKDI